MERKIIVSREDYEFFGKLASIYTALAHCVTSPVVLSTGSKDERFEGIFYDCVENEREAERIMIGRITKDYSDITKHLGMYERLNNFFYDLEEQGINTKNRKNIAFTARQIGTILEGISDRVVSHKKTSSAPFLDYPYCPIGHTFHIKGQETFLTRIFNSSGDLSVFESELDLLRKMAVSFDERKGNFPAFILNESYDSGEGIHGTSLRSRLELTKELLRRVGMVEI